MIQVGDIVTLERGCMGNIPGTLAVCYDVYELGDHRGVGLIFPNGRYDGFSSDDVEIFGVRQIGHAPSIADYRFENVMKLSEDFRSSLFTSAVRQAMWDGR